MKTKLLHNKTAASTGIRQNRLSLDQTRRPCRTPIFSRNQIKFGPEKLDKNNFSTNNIKKMPLTEMMRPDPNTCSGILGKKNR